MMATLHGIEATTLPDFTASWSNRNGGELLLIGGSIRMIVSAAWAQSIVDKFSKALDVPKRAAEMAVRTPASEPERIAAPDTMLAEPLRYRKAALSASFPSRSARLEAVTRGLENSDAAAEVVSIGGIYFTPTEADVLRTVLTHDQVGMGEG